MTISLNKLKENVALSCRIMADLGLFQETRGHVSARTQMEGHMLIRCRGLNETGLLFTEEDSVRLANFDGQLLDNESELYEIPNEHPIHGEIYKRRPDVGCVIHAHSPAAMLCSITNLDFKPIYGGYDPQSIRQCFNGVPEYSSSITLTNAEVVTSMLKVMGEQNICLLKGHGVVITGVNIEETTIRALKFEELAKITIQVAQTGKEAVDISQNDIDYFNEMFAAKKKSTGLNMSHIPWLWKYYVKMLRLKGLDDVSNKEAAE
jgi:ribulose-5-phosphate 4-epimerase/fuculose-1-phosphate aldolase